MTGDNGNRVEQVTPYGNEGTAKTEQVRQMFDSIAPAYDFMNRAMTMGIDIWWRRLAVKRLKRGDRHGRLCHPVAAVTPAAAHHRH